MSPTHSFRTILSNRNNLVNVNFSKGGASNQGPFRRASEYFIRDKNVAQNSIVMGVNISI